PFSVFIPSGEFFCRNRDSLVIKSVQATFERPSCALPVSSEPVSTGKVPTGPLGAMKKKCDNRSCPGRDKELTKLSVCIYTTCKYLDECRRVACLKLSSFVTVHEVE
ncbi:unnamed protein product, partial [Ectocarpus sp. 12 AP-2014]